MAPRKKLKKVPAQTPPPPDASASTILDRAKAGDKVTPTERRLALVYLEETGQLEDLNAFDLAAIFGVSDSVIRQDRKTILQEYAAALTPDQAMTFVAKYLKRHEDLIIKARGALSVTNPGGVMHRNYLETISDLETKYWKALQESGLVRKELGHLNVTEEVWEAHVSDEGLTSVSRVSGEPA